MSDSFDEGDMYDDGEANADKEEGSQQTVPLNEQGSISPISGSGDNLSALTTMFPDVEVALLNMVLQSCGAVELAAATLKEMGMVPAPQEDPSAVAGRSVHTS